MRSSFVVGGADPDQTLPLHERAAVLAPRPLADEQVEAVVLQPPVQGAALVDGQVEVDARVVAAEVAQDLG